MQQEEKQRKQIYDPEFNRHVDKQDCVPTLMPGKTFFYSYPAERKGKCIMKDCNASPIGQCEYKLCQYPCCQTHVKHGHWLCQILGCKNYATTFSPSRNVECCDYHHFYLEARYYTTATLCKTCSKPLLPERKLIGHCSNCNGMWHVLSKRGIRGPFG